MPELWINISEIGPEGEDFVFDDQSFWEESFNEYHIDARITSPVVGKVRIQPMDEGCLFRGTVEGDLTFSCDRCTGDAPYPVRAEFELFEDFEHSDESENEPLFRENKGELELDAGLFLWQQFSLDLPHKILCKDGCKGLCPKCGKDLNAESCACEQTDGDPRMAALRNLKVDK